jgi:hypothetical protein
MKACLRSTENADQHDVRAAEFFEAKAIVVLHHESQSVGLA